jgi:microcystin-dependent protein
MTLYKWSQTAANDASADPSINWMEGQSPSSINDSARAMMAATAKYRDDTAGRIVTAGTSTAYTATSNQIFDSVAHMTGMEIAVIVHATNGAAPTFNVDGLGALPISTAAGVAVPAGTMIANSAYSLFCNASEWLLKGFYGNPYNIPIAGMMDWIAPAVPNSNFVFPIGQAISRTTYATLFGLVGTTYGIGDGSTTFNVPDLTGRVPVMKEASATRLTSTYFGGNSTVLGAVGGLESNALTLAQVPTGITSNGTLSLSGPASYLFNLNNDLTGFSSTSGGNVFLAFPQSTTHSVGGVNASGTVTSNNTSGTAHNNVQPTIIVNKILRII